MTLKSVYEDPLTSTRDPALLAKRAGVTVKSAKSFLHDQSSSQVAQQWRKPAASSGVYAPTGAPPGHWQADVIFFEDYQGVNDRRKAMLTVLHTTTRYAVVRPLLSTKSEKRLRLCAPSWKNSLEVGLPRVERLRSCVWTVVGSSKRASPC